MHFQKIPNPSSFAISVTKKNPRSSQKLYTTAYEIFEVLGGSTDALDTWRIPIPGIYLLGHNAEKEINVYSHCVPSDYVIPLRNSVCSGESVNM